MHAYRPLTTLTMLLLGIAPGFGPQPALGDDPFPLTEHTTVHFASQQQGRQLLSRPDPFLESLSPFDLEIRVQAPGATHADLLRAIDRDVIAWEPDDQARYRQVLETLRTKLARFQIPWPADIWLVRTRGAMESGAAYCRQEAIVMPERMDRRSPAELERLLTHELFHVLSNQNPELRAQLYRIVGFERMAPLTLPASLADRKITNPDAPRIDCFLWIVEEGEVHPAAPVLLARSRYRADGPQSLFALLEFHLALLEPIPAHDGNTSAGPVFQVRHTAGQPHLVTPDRACLFWNIGINTNYIIHPEEVLADNFVHLIHGHAELPTPRIVNELRRLFTSR